MIFYWSPSDSKSPQVSRTLISILPDPSSPVVSIFFLVCSFFCLFSRILETIPGAPTTIGIIFTLMFHNFFNSAGRSKYSSVSRLSFHSMIRRNSKIHWMKSYFLSEVFVVLVYQSKTQCHVADIHPWIQFHWHLRHQDFTLILLILV